MDGGSQPARLIRLGDAMTRAMAEQEVTFRTLAKLTGLSSGYLVSVRQGNENPSTDTVMAVCGALGIPFEQVAEYRLAVARRLFDPRQITLEQAVANLARLSVERAEDAEDLDLPPFPDDDGDDERGAQTS